MDPIQLVIIIVTSILTILFVVLGIQVWHILKEIRISVQKMNKMLDDMGRITGAVGQSAENFGGLLSGIKAGLSIFSSLRKKDADE